MSSRPAVPLTTKPSLSGRPIEAMPTRHEACGGGAVNVGRPIEEDALEISDASHDGVILIGPPCRGGSFKAGGVWRRSYRGRSPCRGGVLKVGNASHGRAAVIGLPCQDGARGRRRVEVEPLRYAILPRRCPRGKRRLSRWNRHC